jgi:hypothetical protein
MHVFLHQIVYDVSRMNVQGYQGHYDFVLD